ncbi:competence regulator inhibitor paratox [Streptococcus fryi]
MFYKSELEEMIERGLVQDTVNVIRKNGQIFDVVLDGEPIKDDEVVTVEDLAGVLNELSTY